MRDRKEAAKKRASAKRKRILPCRTKRMRLAIREKKTARSRSRSLLIASRYRSLTGYRFALFFGKSNQPLLVPIRAPRLAF